MIAGVRAKTSNTTYPFATMVVDLSKAGFAKASLGWLANLMDLYDLFKIEDLEVEWVPSASSFTTGCVEWYYDPSPNAKAPTTFEGAAGNANLVSTQVSKPKRAKVPSGVLRQRLAWYLTDGEDPSTTTQGSLVFVLSEGTVPSATGTVFLGSLWVTYTIALKNPSYIAPSREGEEPIAPLLEQLIYDELSQVNSAMTRQVEAQEQVAEDVAIIASKPGVTPGLGGDVSAISARLSAIESILSGIDVDQLNSMTGRMTTNGGVIRRVNNRWNLGYCYSTEGPTLPSRTGDDEDPVE